MKLRQHGLRSWPCWLPNAGNHPPVKTARKGTPHEKSSSPRESCFFRGLDWRGVSMLHRAAIPLVTHSAASCLASGDLLVLHLKIDIFCHLSIFFLTSAVKSTKRAVPVRSHTCTLCDFVGADDLSAHGSSPDKQKACHCEPVRAAKQVPLGYRLAWQSVSKTHNSCTFPQIPS